MSGGFKLKPFVVAEMRASYDAASKTYEDLQRESEELQIKLAAADAHLSTMQTQSRAAKSAKEQASSQFKRATPGEHQQASARWHQAIQDEKVATEKFREAREAKYKVEALIEIIAKELGERRGLAYSLQALDPSTVSDVPVLESKKPRSSVMEDCPWCGHPNTVRDGLSNKLDKDGNRLQQRKCQCRGKTHPCKNCPTCNSDPNLINATKEEQVVICQDILDCETCRCRCVGVGKWIEGDEASRQQYRERTEARHSKINALIVKADTEGTTTHLEDVLLGKGLRRLPADIKEQLQAVAAAHSLLAVTQVDSQGKSDASNKRQRVVEEASDRGGTKASRLRRTTTRNSSYASDDDYYQDEHHHNKQHHCQHPHEECTSECCSAA